MKISDKFFLFFNVQIFRKHELRKNEPSKRQYKKIKKSNSLIEL